MIFRTLVIATLMWAVPLGAAAEAREMSQSDLRRAVAEGQAIETRRLIAGVERHTGGKVFEIRGFWVDDTVVYRILVHGDDGQIGSVMVDGSTGYAVTSTSRAGRRVTDFAQEETRSQPDKPGNNGQSRGRGRNDTGPRLGGGNSEDHTPNGGQRGGGRGNTNGAGQDRGSSNDRPGHSNGRGQGGN